MRAQWWTVGGATVGLGLAAVLYAAFSGTPEGPAMGASGSVSQVPRTTAALPVSATELRAIRPPGLPCEPPSVLRGEICVVTIAPTSASSGTSRAASVGRVGATTIGTPAEPVASATPRARVTRPQAAQPRTTTYDEREREHENGHAREHKNDHEREHGHEDDRDDDRDER